MKRAYVFREFAHACATAIGCVLACALLVGTAQASADGVAGPGGGAAFEPQAISAPGGAFAGRAAKIVGRVAADAHTVTIEVRGPDGLWTVLGTAAVNGDGSFEVSWTPPAAGRYDFRFTPVGSARVAGDEPDGSLSVYRLQRATWYGPGFYGRRTACGGRLTRSTLGVAHRSLPCGTRVELFSGGRRITVPVIDRGPFVRGVSWDLTYATARRLRALSTVKLGALPLG